MGEQEGRTATLPANYCIHLIDGKPFPLPDGTPGSERYLHDFPTMPWMLRNVEAYRRQWGLGGEERKRRLIEEYKRQYYFEDRVYIFRKTPQGKLIVATFDRDGVAAAEYYQGMSPETRRELHVGVVPLGWPGDPEGGERP